MYQTYKEKMAVLFKTASFPDTSSSILVTPLENLSFSELDDLCNKENILMVEMPSFAFNFSTMKIDNGLLVAPGGKTIRGFPTSPLIKPFQVASRKCDSMEHFYKEIWNDKDLFFFYSGVKVCGSYTLRFAKIERSKFEKAASRYEAVVRLNSKINITNTFESIQEYVNSDIFKSDMEQANIDINIIAKELWESMRDLSEIEQDDSFESKEPTSPRLNPHDRMTLGMEQTLIPHIQDDLTKKS